MSGAELTLLVHHDRPELFVDVIEAGFPQVRTLCCRTYGELADSVRQARPDILLSYKFEARPYPRDAAYGHPGLRWVHCGGTGIDHLIPWNPARVVVTNSAGLLAPIMAQYALCGIFALNLKFPAFVRAQASRQWRPRDVTSAAGQTLCVVGLGHIGQAIARLARAAAMTVIGVSRSGAPRDGIERVYKASHLREALARADHTAIVVPLTPQTRGLIGEREIAAMKPGASLVNISRGGVVDEAPLIAALSQGRLGGAVLDVFAREPLPEDSPLWGLDNVIVTPHSSSIFSGWERAAAEMFCANLRRFIAGEPLNNVVDPARGY